MKLIPLTQGKFAIVDDEDYDWLNQWKWFHMSRGYAARNGSTTNGNPAITILMHRQILNIPNGIETDHRNCNPLDNQKHNLRIATSAENARNQRKRKNNSSGFKGVSYHKSSGLFYARIWIDWNCKSLGYYRTATEAHAAYCEAAVKLHGEFART